MWKPGWRRGPSRLLVQKCASGWRSALECVELRTGTALGLIGQWEHLLGLPACRRQAVGVYHALSKAQCRGQATPWQQVSSGGIEGMSGGIGRLSQRGPGFSSIEIPRTHLGFIETLPLPHESALASSWLYLSFPSERPTSWRVLLLLLVYSCLGTVWSEASWKREPNSGLNQMLTV